MKNRAANTPEPQASRRWRGAHARLRAPADPGDATPRERESGAHTARRRGDCPPVRMPGAGAPAWRSFEGAREGVMTEGGVSIDPICGKPVVEEDGDSFEYKRKTYYFCSAHCRGRFERQADRIHVSELAKMGS